MNSAEICQKNGWVVGDYLIGFEFSTLSVLKITAIGEKNVLAREVLRNGLTVVCPEATWALECREWKLHGLGKNRTTVTESVERREPSIPSYKRHNRDLAQVPRTGAGKLPWEQKGFSDPGGRWDNLD